MVRSLKHISLEVWSEFHRKQNQTEDLNDIEEEEIQAEARPTAQIIDRCSPRRMRFDKHTEVHLLYRKWCSHCVRAVGQAAHHRRQAQSDHMKPEFHLYHMCMGSTNTNVAKDTKAVTALGVKE